MVRSFIVILLLAVFFLTGMLLGIDRGSQGVEKNTNFGVDIKESSPTVIENEVVEQTEVAQVDQAIMTIDTEAPVHFTQQTASILEGAVKFFYEAVVQILYQISQLFF